MRSYAVRAQSMLHGAFVIEIDKLFAASVCTQAHIKITWTHGLLRTACTHSLTSMRALQKSTAQCTLSVQYTHTALHTKHDLP